jgi:hypothetical protein
MPILFFIWKVLSKSYAIIASKIIPYYFKMLYAEEKPEKKTGAYNYVV